MLSPQEFGAGTLSEAQPLALVLPRDKYESMFIVGWVGEESVAVFLSEQWKFRAFACGQNTDHGGLIVPGVDIEVDETSLFKIDRFYAPLGGVVRLDDGLFLGIQLEGQMGRGGSGLRLVSGLPPFKGQVGFTKWSVTVGRGQGKRTLYEIDAANPTR
jgi:hypothetical protein